MTRRPLRSTLFPYTTLFRSERLEQVPANHPGWIPARDAQRPLQPLTALFVLGPDQRLQPRAGAVIGDIDRVQVDPGPPHHLRYGTWWGQAGAELARRSEEHTSE